MAGLVVVMIVIARDDELAAIGGGLRFGAISKLGPALCGTSPSEPFVLRIRQQHLAVLRRAQNIDAERLGCGGNESAAMGMFAGRRFGNAGGQSGIPIDVLAGDPFALDPHGVEHLHIACACGVTASAERAAPAKTMRRP